MYSLCHGVDRFYIFVLLHGQDKCNFPRAEKKSRGETGY